MSSPPIIPPFPPPLPQAGAQPAGPSGVPGGAAPAPAIQPLPDPQVEPPNVFGIVAEDDTQGTPDALRRTRPEPQAFDLTGPERDEIAQRIIRFADECEEERSDDLDARIQLHAKFMQWASERDTPWEDAHPVSSPDIMSACLRTEDTLQNSVMSQRPVMNSKALDPANTERERTVDRFQDYQFFNAQPGEKLVESLTCDFVREGDTVAYVHWVHERRTVVRRRTFEPLSAGVIPRLYFEGILKKHWTSAKRWQPTDTEGWDWRVWETSETDPIQREFTVNFYTREKPTPCTVMRIESEVVAFDAPKIDRMPYERVLHPVTCENLQAPSPSNPTGAPYVILVDYPTLDEVRRLAADGTYDLLTTTDVDDWVPDGQEPRRAAEMIEAKRDMLKLEPRTGKPRYEARNHGQVTRLTCFDVWASDDGMGPSVDVVWTVLEDLNGGTLARARYLGEVMPSVPPMRPLAHGVMVPIPGLRTGLGLPAIMEQLHDWEVKVKEQMVDAADIEITPSFTYRQSASVLPVQYIIAPGVGNPVTQKDDITPMQFGGRSGPVALNQLGLIKQDRESLVSIGDLQMGKIPAGKSSALRTASGIQQVLAQGEARPERILRRYFMFMRDIWRMMYALNKHYVDREQTVRTTGVGAPDEDPFLTIARVDFSGDMDFDFVANVFNTGRLQLQEAMQTVLGVLLNPLPIQLGISTPDTVYRALHDMLNAAGVQPEKYLNPPTPTAAKPLLFASEALTLITQGQMPDGSPGEGSIEAHMATLQQMLSTPLATGRPMFESLSPSERELLNQYMTSLQQQLIAQQQQALLAAAGPQLAQDAQGPKGAGRPPGGGGAIGAPPGPVGEGDVADESLPASGTVGAA